MCPGTDLLQRAEKVFLQILLKERELLIFRLQELLLFHPSYHY